MSPWAVGDELTTARLAERDAEILSGRVRVAPGSGLAATYGTDGTHLRTTEAPEGFYRVQAANPAAGTGWYTLLEQLDTPDGSWGNGTRQIVAREVNASTAVKLGAIVRSWRGRTRWDFQYGACS